MKKDEYIELLQLTLGKNYLALERYVSKCSEQVHVFVVSKNQKGVRKNIRQSDQGELFSYISLKFYKAIEYFVKTNKSLSKEEAPKVFMGYLRKVFIPARVKDYIEKEVRKSKRLEDKIDFYYALKVAGNLNSEEKRIARNWAINGDISQKSVANLYEVSPAKVNRVIRKVKENK
ncbi:MAG: hypothetical protein KC478_12370 [Bacteriovoracaceae bacterium]|nr:hypothetical protein [Bacteriovoracaceae bacterium]